MNNLKKLLLIGHGSHGKDTVAEILQKLYGYQFYSSSKKAAEIFIYNELGKKYGYASPEECYNDRINKRKEWHDLICDYNKDDKARLAKDIMVDSQMYVGMRSDAEVQECVKQGVFDLIIGIYDNRKPLEGKDSFDIDIWQMSDIIIPNTGTIQDLENRISKIKDLIVR